MITFCHSFKWDFKVCLMILNVFPSLAQLRMAKKAKMMMMMIMTALTVNKSGQGVMP